MNDNIFYIQDYYHYLISFIGILIILSFLSYFKNKRPKFSFTIPVISFALFTVYYIGNRNVYIGVDTIRYENAFLYYKNLQEFEIRKDLFYDLLSFLISRFSDFQTLLIFCAFLYVFGALYGLKKIFKKEYYLAFFVFLISPYFFGNGISAIRSGVAASLLLLGLGVYYEKGNTWKVILLIILSILFHISMFVPVLFLFLTRFVKNTKAIFVLWSISILLGILKINIIMPVVEAFDTFASRMDTYAVNEGERDFWMNFVIFGFFPVVFAVYNILILKYKNDFYKWIVNAYMLIHVPYIVLINSEYGLRLGYLAEFMMPIILIFPLLIDPKIKIKYVHLKLGILIFCVFMIKAYKVLLK
ncbi:EpsG family protein [Polaribacter sp. IC073]|uniref:EpsG family protein n=1 Tax=Polaribacter sp. IC073 TaxID=2508540 RepID=UPI0011BE7464|nr:EpsG family protein [Polaribacter sp. IC073]TXD48922.1 EpsG family protein [Polaribacter sp. IC073]